MIQTRFKEEALGDYRLVKEYLSELEKEITKRFDKAKIENIKKRQMEKEELENVMNKAETVFFY